MIPISNAAGTVKLIEQARRLSKVSINEIVLGSYTIEERIGNQGHVYEPPLNALGLPNPGCTYLAEFRNELLTFDQNIVVSIAADSTFDYVALAAVFDWAPAIELNFGCPNRWSNDEQQERILSFDLIRMNSVVSEVAEMIRMRRTNPVELRIKLSPYSDPWLLEQVADFCIHNDLVVVTANTFPNGWLPGWGKKGPKYGGVSGLKEVALGQVHQFKERGVKRVIGVGGIRTGEDIKDFEAAGADQVQVASRYLQGNEDPDVFVNLIADYY